MSLGQAMFRKKPCEAPSEDAGLNRCLALKDLIGIGVGATLGAGVYILSGEVAVQKAGPAVTVCFAIAAFASILSGMCYAELGCRVPKAGSGYAYLYVTLGELAAFSVGWCLVLSYVLGTSSVAAAFTGYVNDITGGAVVKYFNNIPIGWPGFRETADVFSLLVIGILCTFMCMGVENVSKLTNACTVVNLATIALITILCTINFSISNWSWNTELNSDDLPAFYKQYYVDTPGVEGVIPDVSNPSFVQQYCEGGNYTQSWIVVDDKNRFQMTCQLNEQTSAIDGLWDKQGKNINLDVVYGSYLFSGNESTNTVNIVDSKPGDGGYLPFGMSGVWAGATSCFYGFVGFDAIATTGEEAIDPQKNIPKAITWALAIICGVYAEGCKKT